MAKVLILGSTGSLGRHVVQPAIDANHTVSVLVRTSSKLPAAVRENVTVHETDLMPCPALSLTNIFQANEVVINTAGFVTEQQIFVELIDHVVTSLEAIPKKDQPVCWFMAGAALLDMDNRGRKGVDLPAVKSTYWPHDANFKRIRSTTLDWRILCPGPLVDQPPLGLTHMRISQDRLPVQIPACTRVLPAAFALPFFTYRIPEMIVSYADAAALMLAHLTPKEGMSCHRIGLALPSGRRGKKKQWAAKPKSA